MSTSIIVSPISLLWVPALHYCWLTFCSASLIRRPMATQCIASAALFGAGDVIAQQAIDRKGFNHDVSIIIILWQRIILMTVECDSLHVSLARPYGPCSVLWRYVIVCPHIRARPSECHDTMHTGAIFGPLLTKWIQFLNRLQFASPTRAVIYRVPNVPTFWTALNWISLGYRFGWTRRCSRQVSIS